MSATPRESIYQRILREAAERRADNPRLIAEQIARIRNRAPVNHASSQEASRREG